MENNNALESLSIFFMKMAKFFFKVAVFFVVIYLLGMQLFKLGYRLFYESAVDNEKGEEIIFEIKKGDSVDTIADNLEKAGLIDDPLVFKFRSLAYKTDFTPNVYNLNKNMTIKNLLDVFDNPTDENLVAVNTNSNEIQLGSEEDVVINDGIESDEEAKE